MAVWVPNERVRRFADRTDPSQVGRIVFSALRFQPLDPEAAAAQGEDRVGGEVTVARRPSGNPPPLSPYLLNVEKVERDPERIRSLVEALCQAVRRAELVGFDDYHGECFEFYEKDGRSRWFAVHDEALEWSLGPEVMRLLQRYVEPTGYRLPTPRL